MSTEFSLLPTLIAAPFVLAAVVVAVPVIATVKGFQFVEERRLAAREASRAEAIINEHIRSKREIVEPAPVISARDVTVVAVGTRMKNDHLLLQALADTGSGLERVGDVITARWGDRVGRFTRDPEGTWSVHVAGDRETVDSATQLVNTVYAAYGLRVQHELLTRLRAQAPSSGFGIESERVEADRSITMVLRVQGSA